MVTKTRATIDESCCQMKSLDGYCPKPMEEVSSYLSKKWTISIIVTVGNFGSLRFNDLKERLEKATSKILSERLKELEQEKIIKRKQFNTVPLHVEYSLTKKGETLLEALLPLVGWAEKEK